MPCSFNTKYQTDAIQPFTFMSYRPELDEVLQRCGGHVETVDQRVHEEQQKEFIVGKANAVADPVHILQRRMQLLKLVFKSNSVSLGQITQKRTYWICTQLTTYCSQIQQSTNRTNLTTFKHTHTHNHFTALFQGPPG